jgi:hypothetical protein
MAHERRQGSRSLEFTGIQSPTTLPAKIANQSDRVGYGAAVVGGRLN